MTQRERLVRPRRGGWIAGVCAGLARRFDLPVGLVRVGYVLFSILPLFPGIPVYIVLWILIPREAAPAALPGAGDTQPKEAHG